MPMKTKSSGKFISIFILLFLTNAFEIQAQSSVNLKAGIGVPEWANFAAGIQSENIQFTIGIGSLPFPDDKLFALNGNLYLHMLGDETLLGFYPWYLRSGLTYMKESRPNWIDTYTYLDFRIGKTFYLGDHFTIEADAGIGIELSYKRQEILPSSSFLLIHFPVVPELGVRLVYSINI